MAEQVIKMGKGPLGKLGRIFINLLVTLVVGLVYFYVSLPALHPQNPSFYGFLLLLCVIYTLCALITSGVGVRLRVGFREYFSFVRSQCLPIGILLLMVFGAALIGEVISLPIFRAAAYRDLLPVQTGDFAADISEISFREIPTLDRSSAEYLGDRQMGTLSDMVSQFEYSNDSTQINYRGRPVRVAPLDYADLIKWFTNRSQGLPAYVVVDMVTQEASVTRLAEGMKYSFSEPLNRNIIRHLRFRYPTMMFAEPQFEIDEEGHPWWIAPRVVKRIGLFGGADIQGAVLADAVTGDCTYYEEVPTWVDTLYVPDLIMSQYDYHGTLVHGFLNSIFGQKDVTKTTEGYNYIAMNDDVYVYTGVTSANADQSNLGFLLCNMRTKETRFYTAPGATEAAARLSAEGKVQHLHYTATWPILLNIAGEPTYFIPLLDATNLVKMYAMVNVAQYQLVANESTVTATERAYISLLNERGITSAAPVALRVISGTVEDVRMAVVEGNTHCYVKLTVGEDYYEFTVSESPSAILLSPGDRVRFQAQTETAGAIVPAYSLEPEN